MSKKSVMQAMHWQEYMGKRKKAGRCQPWEKCGSTMSLPQVLHQLVNASRMGWLCGALSIHARRVVAACLNSSMYAT